MHIDELVDICHQDSIKSGWWSDPITNERYSQINVPEKLCLIHSEISEAMEADRKNLMDDKLKHRPGIEVELADAVIRIADLCGFLELDLEGAIQEKLEYNRNRADHKRENRMAAGGKKY